MTQNTAPSEEHADQPRYNGHTVLELASQAEQALLGIVHLTQGDVTPLEPDQVYRALSALTRAVEQLPDSITQLASQLTAWNADGELAVVAGPHYDDPDGAVDAMNAAVQDEAIPALGKLRTGLDHAQAAVSQTTRVTHERQPGRN
jgi:hypothetical protein